MILLISPYIGYSAYHQKLRFRHGNGWNMSAFYGGKSAAYKIHGLNSTFTSTWYGPLLGCSFKKPICKNVSLSAGYSLIFPLKYDARGHWNLRHKDSQNFDLHNNATKSFGNIAIISLEWLFAAKWLVKAEYEFMKFYAQRWASAYWQVQSTYA